MYKKLKDVITLDIDVDEANEWVKNYMDSLPVPARQKTLDYADAEREKAVAQWNVKQKSEILCDKIKELSCEYFTTIIDDFLSCGSWGMVYREDYHNRVLPAGTYSPWKHSISLSLIDKEGNEYSDTDLMTVLVHELTHAQQYQREYLKDQWSSKPSKENPVKKILRRNSKLFPNEKKFEELDNIKIQLEDFAKEVEAYSVQFNFYNDFLRKEGLVSPFTEALYSDSITTKLLNYSNKTYSFGKVQDEEEETEQDN